MDEPARRRRSGPPGGLQRLSPQRKWAAITLGTLLFAPAYWSTLLGAVALASDDSALTDASAAAAVAFGLAVIPFVFMLLAFTSEHPAAPGAVVRAMGLSLLVGLPISALAADAVTGLIAGVGAGGIVALRADDAHEWRTRAAGVAIAASYTFLLARVAPAGVLLAAPVFPLTAIGLADHWSEWRQRGATDRAPDADAVAQK